MKDRYVRIEAIVHQVTSDAARLLPTGKGAFPAPVWLPRSLIHGGDDLRLAKALRNDTVTLRVMEWKAKELGLAPVRQHSQSELDL